MPASLGCVRTAPTLPRRRRQKPCPGSRLSFRRPARSPGISGSARLALPSSRSWPAPPPGLSARSSGNRSTTVRRDKEGKARHPIGPFSFVLRGQGFSVVAGCPLAPPRHRSLVQRALGSGNPPGPVADRFGASCGKMPWRLTDGVVRSEAGALSLRLIRWVKRAAPQPPGGGDYGPLLDRSRPLGCFVSSHSLTVPSAPAEARVLPSGEKASDITMCSCPRSVATSSPVVTSHSLTSALVAGCVGGCPGRNVGRTGSSPTASVLLSEENASERTPRPSKSDHDCRLFPVAVSQTLTRPSSSAEATSFPSADTATQW